MYEVVPGLAIGPIALGMSRDEVRSKLGTPSYIEAAYRSWDIDFPDKDCFSQNCVQVRYDSYGKVEDIQVSAHESFLVTFDGVPVHDSSVETIAEAIGKKARLDMDEGEYPSVYFYPELGLSLWRESRDKVQFDTINIRKPEPKKKGEPDGTDNDRAAPGRV